jgi:hypothetical protein
MTPRLPTAFSGSSHIEARSVRGATSDHHLEEQVYVLAPFEGWIALRSLCVPAIYDTLPAYLQEIARK